MCICCTVFKLNFRWLCNIKFSRLNVLNYWHLVISTRAKSEVENLESILWDIITFLCHNSWLCFPCPIYICISHHLTYATTVYQESCLKPCLQISGTFSIVSMKLQFTASKVRKNCRPLCLAKNWNMQQAKEVEGSAAQILVGMR